MLLVSSLGLRGGSVQLRLRGSEPLPTRLRPAQLRGRLVAGRIGPNRASSPASTSAASASIAATCSSMWLLLRLAANAAGQPILVPSTATSPTLTIPACAHSRSDSVKTVASACSWRWRNRAIVV